jgi:hypothetical protein
MVFLLFSLVGAAIAVAILLFRQNLSAGSLIRSGITKGDFPIAREGAARSSVAGSLQQFLVVVLPDGKIVTPNATDRVVAIRSLYD